MRKMSLRNKILLYFLIVPFCAFTIAGILTIVDMYELRSFAAKTGTDVADEATHESIFALKREVHAELQMLAEAQARICQLQMQRVIAELNDLSALYSAVLSGEYKVGDKGFVHGEICEHSFHDDFVCVNYPGSLSRDKVLRGLRKLTMMRNAFKFSCAYNDYYIGMGIALPNGLFFKYDWFPVPLDYDVRKTRWFRNAIARKGEVVWQEPVVSSVSNRLILTCSKAVVVNGKVEAVIMLDILPQTISNEFVVTRDTGCFAFMLAPSGEMIAREDIISKKLIWKISPKEKTEFQKAVLEKIATGKKGNFVTTFRGERMDVAYCPMFPGGGGIGVAAPIANIRAAAGKAAEKIKEKKKVYILSTREYIEERILLYLGIGMVVSIIMLFLAAWVARHLGKPIVQLEAGMEMLGQRKLNEKIRLNSNDEFQDLGDTLNSMASELNKQIDSLKENIAHQERARHELLVASEIQRAMLPEVSLVFPDHDEFDIYAEMHPAKEVGGDFYDFFFVDKKHLFFAIGDISGKGLPAALFMMRALTLLRHEAEDGVAPDEIFVNVGNELEHNNDSCMFFTATCGLLDVNTGEVVLSNAGHPPPYLRHENTFREVEIENGVIVGALPLTREQFSIKKLQLQKGDTLFLYTDGVTEAFNPKLVEYQSERLRAALHKLTGANPREILDGITKSISDFAEGAPQSDDITMLTIKYYG